MLTWAVLYPETGTAEKFCSAADAAPEADSRPTARPSIETELPPVQSDAINQWFLTVSCFATVQNQC